MKNIEFIVALRGPCNYSCYYCVGSNQQHPITLMPLKKIEDIYYNTGAFTVTSIECGASEPSIHPQIKDLLQIFLKSGTVSLPTNNSIDPVKWLPQNSNKILIRAALHPQSEQDIEGFITRLQKAQELGASVSIEFVAHPSRLSKIDDYKELFNKYNLRFNVNGFTGIYNEKKYPDNYTDEEKNKIGIANNTWYARLKLDILDRNFYGMPCLAGHTLIYIDETGNIQRCLYDKKPIDKIYDINLPCQVNNCGCGLYLEQLNNQSIAFWNYWYKVAGIEQIPDTNKKSEDDLYIENKKIYKGLKLG